MVEKLQKKFKEFNINVEQEHDLAFTQELLDEEANGLPVDDDVCGMVLNLCYTKARDLLVEAKNNANHSGRNYIEVEDLSMCKEWQAEDLCDASTHIKRSKALVNRYPIIVPPTTIDILMPTWRTCQVGSTAHLKGANLKPLRPNGIGSNDTYDYDEDDLIEIMNLERELLNSSSSYTTTDTEDITTDDETLKSNRNFRKIPTTAKMQKLDDADTSMSDQKSIKLNSFKESVVTLKSRPQPTLSAATASALKFALMRRPPPRIQKISRNKAKKPKLNPQSTKSEGSTGGGTGGAAAGGASSTKSKSKQTTGKPKSNIHDENEKNDQTEAENRNSKKSSERSKQTNLKNDVSKTSANNKTVKDKDKAKETASTKKTTSTSSKKVNPPKSSTISTNSKSLDNSPSTKEIATSSGGIRIPKINIIQNFKRDLRGSRARKKR